MFLDFYFNYRVSSKKKLTGKLNYDLTEGSTILP